MTTDGALGSEGRERAHSRWSQMTYWPLAIVAAVVFLITYTVHVIGDVQGRRPRRHDVMIGRDLGRVHRRLPRAPAARIRPRPWFRTHKLRSPARVVLPALRPVRLLDALTRIAPFTRTAGRLHPRAPADLRRRVPRCCWSGIISLLVLQAERHAPGATITTFGDRGLVGLLHRDHRRVRRLRARSPRRRPRSRSCPDGGRRRRGRPSSPRPLHRGSSSASPPATTTPSPPAAPTCAPLTEPSCERPPSGSPERTAPHRDAPRSGAR